MLAVFLWSTKGRDLVGLGHGLSAAKPSDKRHGTLWGGGFTVRSPGQLVPSAKNALVCHHTIWASKQWLSLPPYLLCSGECLNQHWLFGLVA